MIDVLGTPGARVLEDLLLETTCTTNGYLQWSRMESGGGSEKNGPVSVPQQNKKPMISC